MSKEIEVHRKEIEVHRKGGKFAAQRMVEQKQEVNLGRAGLGNFVLNWGGLTAPIWLTAGAVSLISPWMALATIPVGLVISLTIGAVTSQSLKIQMDKERLRAFDEVQSLYSTKSALSGRVGVVEQLAGLNPEFTRTLGGVMEIKQAATSHVKIASKAPIRGGGFINRFKSLFGKRKAYVDASQLNEGYGFVLEYTFHMMKLTEVRKIYMVNEERAWEDAFRMSSTAR